MCLPEVSEGFDNRPEKTETTSLWLLAPLGECCLGLSPSHIGPLLSSPTLM